MPTVFSLLWFKPTELCKSCRKASFSSSISFDYLVSLLWQQMPLEINAFSAFNFFFNIHSKTLSISTGNTEIWLRWDLFGCFLVGFFFATKHQLDFILSHTWFCQVAKSRPEYITLDCTARKHFWWTREKNIKLFISEGLNEDLKHLQWNAANTQSQHFPKSLSGTTILIHGQKPKKLLRSFWL